MKTIQNMLEGSHLDPDVLGMSLRVFQRIAEAEGRIHGIDPKEVTFHEVGALDSIVDIVGTAVGIHLLGPTHILSSPVPLGKGFVKAQHGILPVPAPATIELLRGAPVAQAGVEAELVTPTGAAILMEISQDFGPLPPMRVSKIGYGVGSRDLADRPNLLRFILGEPEAEGKTLREDWVVEASIDDMNPEFCEHLMECLLSAGALDVTWTPVVMKKGRPGGTLHVLSGPNLRETLSEIILRESTSIGVRFYPVRRHCLERRHHPVETASGTVRIKVSSMKGATLNALPEYEDCRELAKKTGRPLKEIYHEALALFRQE
jgi:uncharacterized protein (TIGR00299 family) protein